MRSISIFIIAARTFSNSPRRSKWSRAEIGLVLSCFMLSLAASQPATAIECAKAATRAEKLICATPALQAIDSDMAKAYEQLKSSLPVAQRPWLQNSQSKWIQDRAGECDSDDTKGQEDGAVVRCLKQQTEERLASLSGARADAPAAAPRLMPVFFHRDGGKGRYEVNLSYPQAPSARFQSLNKLLRQAAEGGQPWKHISDSPQGSLGYDADYSIALQTKSFVSVVFNSVTVSGAAYPNVAKFAVNFDLNANKAATLDDLLLPGSKAKIADICRAQLLKHYGNDEYYEGLISKKAVDEEVDKISNWIFEPDRIQIEFMIGPHAMGDYACKLEGNIATPLLRPDGPVGIAPK